MSSKSTIWGRPIYYNVPPITGIGGYIDDGSTAPDMSIITMTPESTVENKSATTSTNRSKIWVTISTPSMSSKNIGDTRNLILQSRRSTRAKI